MKYSRCLYRLFLLLIFTFTGHLAVANDFLDPREAFQMEALALDGQTIEIRYRIAPGYYLYRDKFRFVAADARLGFPLFPQGKEKQDENFGRVEVYTEAVSIRLPVERVASGPLRVALKITSQGCAEGGLCYPAQHQDLSVDLPEPVPVTETRPPVEANPPSALPDESSVVLRALHQNGFWANIALFFLAGLGLALTPCVFPMIPILSGIIAGQGHHASRGRALALSLMYVLGMAVTYAIAGVLAGLTGTLIAAWMQNTWVLVGFALVFVLLALSMFGLFSLQLPAAWQSKLSDEAGHFANGRGFGLFVMGGLSGLIVGPCVAAPLAGALLYIGQTGNALLGGAALFVLALGMGLPLLVVGLSAGTLLPRSGSWMTAISRGFGVVLLGMALWLVFPLLPPALGMAAWAALCIIPAVFLHVLDPLPGHARMGQRLMKGVGVLLLLIGIALLAGALSGSRNPWQPLDQFRKDGAQAALAFERVASLPELEARLQKTGRPVLLEVYADWCAECRRMERETLTDPAVRARLAGFLLLKADVTAQSEQDRKLLSQLGLFGPPALLLFDRQGKEQTRLRLIGFQTADRLLPVLEQAAR